MYFGAGQPDVKICQSRSEPGIKVLKVFFQEQAMGDHNRLYTLLQLIHLLSRPGGYPVQRLAQRFDVTPRTIYRYFSLFRECGFELEKSGGRYRFQNRGDAESLLPLLTMEEASLLRESILALHPGHPRKADLLNKLKILGDPGPLAGLIVNASVAGVIRTLLEAIREEREVVLKGYHSPGSDTVRDRRVEPVGFSVNMRYLFAYDPEHEAVRQFKPERIGNVEVTGRRFETGDRHEVPRPDLFGMNGTPRTKITLKLNQRATHLLLEECPESSLLDIRIPSGNKATTIQIEVNGFDGVGRFVLGLPGEAVPVRPPEFLRYLEERIGRGG